MSIITMDAIQLIFWTAFFAFSAGWLYSRGERVFALGTLAIGIGGSMARNPFPTDLGSIYGFVGMALFFGGLVILLGVLITRFGRWYNSGPVQS